MSNGLTSFINKIANSKFLGVNSKYFGNWSITSPSGINTGNAGLLNDGGGFKVGWSIHRDKPNGLIRTVFRIGYDEGKHIDVLKGSWKTITPGRPVNFW